MESHLKVNKRKVFVILDGQQLMYYEKLDLKQQVDD